MVRRPRQVLAGDDWRVEGGGEGLLLDIAYGVRGQEGGRWIVGGKGCNIVRRRRLGAVATKNFNIAIIILVIKYRQTRTATAAVKGVILVGGGGGGLRILL